MLPILALILACTGDADPDTGGGSDDGGITDSGAEQLPVDGVSWRVHESIGSLIYVSWTQVEPFTGTVRFGFEEGSWMEVPEADYPAGENEALLLGIPFAADFSFQIIGDGEALTELEQARTGELPGSMPEHSLIIGDPTKFSDEGPYILTSLNTRAGGWTTGTFMQLILDREGRIIWAQETPDQEWSIYLQPSKNGEDILVDHNTYWGNWDGGQASTIHRIKIDGSEVAAYSVPGQHHNFEELPDGSIVYGAATSGGEVLRKLHTDGSFETLWSCIDFHAQVGTEDPCNSNTLWWDPDRDSFLFSFYTTETVVEIDHLSGETLRVWGAVPTAYSFSPEDAQFYWQHGATYTPDGTLLISSESHLADGTSETEVREYLVNDADGTLEEIWFFGEGEGVYARTSGEALRLSNGNTFHNYGSAGVFREVTPDKEIVWEFALGNDHLMGRVSFLEDLYAFAP
jgi:hypothetical protein